MGSAPGDRDLLVRNRDDDVRRFSWRIAYTAARALTRMVGPEKTLDALLDASWIVHRVAFEYSARILGETFKNTSLGVTDDLLRANLQDGARVLDVGCANGRVARRLSDVGARVVGVDTDARAVIEANNSSHAPTTQFLARDATSGFEDLGRFDAALLSHVLEHVDDPGALLLEVSKVTKRAIVEVPDFEADPLNWARLFRQRPFYSDADHLREYTASSIRETLERAGWSVVSLDKRGSCIVVVCEFE